MSFEENTEQFFDPTYGFAVSALYSTFANAGTHPVNAISINVIFDKAIIEVEDDGLVYDRSVPVCQCVESDIPDAVGGRITIEGTVYKIRDTNPDGTGMSQMELEEV